MIDITTSVREAVAKMKRIPRKLERDTLPVLQEAVEKIRRIMARPGLAIRYPVQWDSQKQKRYVIAKLREEDNLPYQRTNAHVNGFGITNLPNGAELSNVGNKAVFLFGTVSGTLAGAQFVQANGQSHIHKDRWRLIRPVVDAVLSRLPKEILEAIKIESNG